MKCPCCSGKEYEKCCAKYLRGEAAPTPLLLMRSRYTAYALHYADYILETTHPDNPQQPTRESVMAFSMGTKFTRLQIHSYDDTTVTFTAFLGKEKFTEKSTFAKIDDRWYYLAGELLKDKGH